MTKSERLWYLVNMIRDRGVMLVREMTQECGVSQRTIYRDLNSLAKMNIPVYYEDGYRLREDARLPLMQLSPTEAQLIRYSLRSNPLTEHPALRERFREIEQKVVTTNGLRKRTRGGDIFLFDQEGDTALSAVEPVIIGEFVRAICDDVQVELDFKAEGRQPEVVMPVAVRLQGRLPSLVGMRAGHAASEEFSVSEIATIRVLPRTGTVSNRESLSRELVSANSG